MVHLMKKICLFDKEGNKISGAHQGHRTTALTVRWYAGHWRSFLLQIWSVGTLDQQGLAWLGVRELQGLSQSQ